MRGGTYARALKIGFSEDQATFFADLGCDTKNEALGMLLDQIKEQQKQMTARYRFASLLRKLANSLSGL